MPTGNNSYVLVRRADGTKLVRAFEQSDNDHSIRSMTVVNWNNEEDEQNLCSSSSDVRLANEFDQCEHEMRGERILHVTSA
jgi:hypothetical protein